METVMTPSFEDCMKIMTDLLGSVFEERDLLPFITAFAKSIGGKEVAYNAVNMRWMFAAADTQLDPLVAELVNVLFYDEIINAIYKDYPEYAAETTVLMDKIMSMKG